MCSNLSESYAKVLEKWEKMTITSDPMFGMVMQNKEICLERRLILVEDYGYTTSQTHNGPNHNQNSQNHKI